MYFIYLIYIQLADRNDQTIFALECPQCGISFLSRTSNYGRSDIFCPFGCRQENKKRRARERSKKHYQKPSKKKIKKELNRGRSLKKDNPDQLPFKSKSVDPFLLYIRIYLHSILKIKIQIQEIIEFQKNLRSRGLSFYRSLIHITGHE